MTHRCRVVLIFGTSSVFGPICFHRVLVYNFSPAGWLFLAGGLHFVRIFGPSLWYHFWSQFLAPVCPPNTRIVIEPQISGHDFWAPVLAPKTGTKNRSVFCSKFRSHFNPILNKVCIRPKLETKSVLVLGTWVHPKQCVTFRCLRFLGSVLVLKAETLIGSSACPSLGIISPSEIVPYAGALASYGLSGRGRLSKTISRRARRSRGARSVVRVVLYNWY